MTQLQAPEILQKIIQEKDVHSLSQAFFQAQPTRGQQEIIQSILFPQKNRICITAFTRYGKTWSLALASALFLLLNEDVSINAIAPVQRQTKKYREYLVEFILSSPVLLEDLDVHADTIARIRKEVSQTRMTFQDGSEVRFLTAGGSNLAQSLMGHGANLVIVDESADISDEIFRKRITRMLGDSQDSVLVEIGNPWRKNHFHDHYTNEQYKSIRISYEQGLREQRINKEFVEQQRRELTDTEFQVLYEAVFPEHTEGGLFNMQWISRSMEAGGFEGGQRVYGLDVAEAGADLNVLTKLRIKRFDGLPHYHVDWIRGWSEADTSNTVNRVLTYLENDEEGQINVDAIGVGKGAADQLQRKRGNTNLVKVGKTPYSTTKKDRYLNQKSEYYWHLRNLFESQRLTLPQEKEYHMRRLLNELEKMRYSFNARGKIEIVDPESSPDYADSLMLAAAPFYERELVFGSAPAF